MASSDDLTQRKSDHLAAVLAGAGHKHATTTGLDGIRLQHCALPDINLASVNLKTSFLGKSLAAPLLISSMTGGPAKAALINERLVAAAAAHGIAFGVGSQRIALEGGPAAGISGRLRALAPSIPIYANFGAAQLGLGYGIDEARRAADMVGADALIIHLNPLQEAVQTRGDHGWAGLLQKIEIIARGTGLPLIVKEVGFGISAPVAKSLMDAGAAAVDVAGAGGTNWALVEGARATSERAQAVAAAFADWGIPTADALQAVRAACPALPLIGSGGIRSGVDAAKAIRLGADIVGQAAGLLGAALVSAEAAHEAVGIAIEQLRIACFVTGARDLAALKKVPLC